MNEFFEELQKLCKKHQASIYPGYTDELEEEEGVIVSIDGDLYELEDVSATNVKVKSLD